MKVTIISYGTIEQDGRLKELIKTCEIIGETQVLATTFSTQKKSYFYIKNLKSKYTIRTYLRYYLWVKKQIKKNSKKDILLIDDTLASFIGYKTRKKFNFVIQDSRELHVDKKWPGLGRVHYHFEKKMFHLADYLISANIERSNIMKEVYGLKTLPYPYENIRFLSEFEYNEKELDKKYANIFKDKKIIISTGGIFLSRGTLELIKAFKELKDCTLLIVGKGDENDYNNALKMMLQEKIENVIILDRVNLSELRYLIKKSQIGVIEYHMNDLNNINCSSGKIYEYIAEGIPVVTTMNTPLVRLTKEHGIGVSSTDFKEAILTVFEKYDYYKENTLKFANKISPEKNNEKLANAIIRAYNEKSDYE